MLTPPELLHVGYFSKHLLKPKLANAQNTSHAQPNPMYHVPSICVGHGLVRMAVAMSVAFAVAVAVAVTVAVLLDKRLL